MPGHGGHGGYRQQGIVGRRLHALAQRVVGAAAVHIEYSKGVCDE
jgi:hypothetical protein